MTLEFLIATTNRKDASFLSALFQHIGLNKVNALVINQLTTPMPLPDIASPHAGIRIVSVVERGLSKSRNRALQHSRGEILILADDDVIYPPDTLTIIQQYHQAYPDDDMLTFRMEGSPKRYAKVARRHTRWNALRVSSCEVTLKRAALPRMVPFDERFGLGAPYPIAEENIWLADNLRKGLSARFVPSTIVRHPAVSTGSRYDAITETARGASFVRMYGLLALPFALWFAIKKYPAFRRRHPLWKELVFLCRGMASFALRR